MTLIQKAQRNQKKRKKVHVSILNACRYRNHGNTLLIDKYAITLKQSV